MKTYHIIQPEVIVGLGDKTEFEEKTPPFLTLKRLHINLEDWLGDDLMECHPAYIVTEALKVALEKSDFSGFTFENMEVTKDEYFNDNYHQKKPLSKFYWMKIAGKIDVDDFFIGDAKSLLANEDLITYLKNNFSTKYLEINPERNEFDDLLDKMIAESKNKNK
jgi:hypothetical protein